MVRMRSEPRTQAYVMRRTAQGMLNVIIQREKLQKVLDRVFVQKS